DPDRRRRRPHRRLDAGRRRHVRGVRKMGGKEARRLKDVKAQRLKGSKAQSRKGPKARRPEGAKGANGVVAVSATCGIAGPAFRRRSCGCGPGSTLALARLVTRNHRRLRVFQEADALAIEAYQLTASLPDAEIGRAHV